MASAEAAGKQQKTYSCVRCFERKVKCDKQHPCAACLRSNTECVFRIPSAPRRRRKRTQEELLQARLQHYESLLRANGISPDAVSPDDGAPEAETEADAFRRLDLSDSPGSMRESVGVYAGAPDTGKLFTVRGNSTLLDNPLFSSVNEELAHSQEVWGDSDDEEQVVEKIHEHFRIDVVLGYAPVLPPMRLLQPSPEQIFKLWQIYLDNVNPLLKITHQPTVQAQLFEAAFNLDKVDRHFEPLMFAIYATATISITESECEELFGEQKTPLIARWLLGARQGLMINRFLGTADLSVLQAFTLYVIATRSYYRPRSTWVMAGIATRIAQGMGLHKDGSTLGLPIFESEMRRRLWWQIATTDARSAELTGSTILGELWPLDVKAPLNVNDSELYPGMTEAPPEHEKATEMTGFLIRNEIINSRIKQLLPWWKTAKLLSQQERAEVEKVIDGIEKNLEEKYLRYLDPSIPIQFQSSIIARSAVCILRFFAHHQGAFSKDDSDPSKLPSSERDLIYNLALKVLEYFNICYTSKMLQGFLWHVKSFFQWRCFIYVLNDLRSRTEGEDADRGWQVVGSVFEHQVELTNAKFRRPLYVAAGQLCLKAWNARERMLARTRGQVLQPPEYIRLLREHKTRGRSGPGQEVIPSFDSASVGANPETAGVVLTPPSNESISNTFGSIQTPSDAGFNAALLNDTLMADSGAIDWSQWENLFQDFDIPQDIDIEGFEV